MKSASQAKFDLPIEARTPILADRANEVVVRIGNPVELEIPRHVDTTYLTHGLFRYVGKLPPPLTAYLLHEYSRAGGTVVDPMCGGGTTGIEAVASGRNFMGFDINPVSRLVTSALTSPSSTETLPTFVENLLSVATPRKPTEGLEKYFSDETFGVLHLGLATAKSNLEKVLLLSVARSSSSANTKKINTVVDASKAPKPIGDVLRHALAKFIDAFEQMNAVASGRSEVGAAEATSLPLESESVDFVLLHPPYLTNTAFSEVTELQLLLLGEQPTKLRARELAYRGSYFHVPNGLKKYLVGWYRIIEEAARIVTPGGHIAIVNGDGQIDGVRIPVGSITEQYGLDIGLRVAFQGVHILNNQTGWTLSHRMTKQHVLVFER